MFDLDAPIIRGKSAAGINIGQPIEEILAVEIPDTITELDGCDKLQFGVVHLWVEDGKVSQIGLYEGYRGCLEQVICIGSTIAEVQSLFGKVEEDEDDTLIVVGMSGWCFETIEWSEGRQPEQNPNAKISEIYIF